MELIVEEITRVRGRVRTRFDNGEEIWLTPAGAAELGLREGDAIGAEALEQFVLLRQYPPALNRAVALLARRACSRGEIEEKLRAARYAPAVVEMVLYKLEREKLLNDRDFADQWVRYRSGGKYGSHRIAQELRRKGVAEDVVEDAMENISEEDQLGEAIAWLRRRYRPEEDPAARRKADQKTLQALVRRGFSWDIAKEALDSVKEEPVR